MGGPEKVARQHEFNKLTIRERIDAVGDDGKSFHEIGALAGVGSYDDDGNLTAFTPSNFVFGTADIDGRPVILSGDDFTVRGGSADASIAGKRTQAEGLAFELRLPHIRLVDGMGGGGSVKTIEMAGRTYIPELRGWETVVRHLGVAPSVSLALGSVAGIGAARVATSHYSVIVKSSAQMMIAGPGTGGLGEPGRRQQGRAGRFEDPHPQRRHRRRGGDGDGSLRARQTVSFPICLRARMNCRRSWSPTTIPRGVRTALIDLIPKDPTQGLQDADRDRRRGG